MTDLDLLVLGCAVSFIAAAGAYVYIRERFAAQREPARGGSAPQIPSRAA